MPHEMAQILCAHGVRPTAQRLAVYAYLCAHRTHPSAETVYQALVPTYPSFSRTTVYNSLHALVEAGLVLELALDAPERRYDAEIAPHGHFYCRCCGAILDFPVEGLNLKWLMPDGCTVLTNGIYASGYCPACGSVSNKN